mmetsp:Transcript_10597/g.25851  ORF Transcript_10597/g.25851 Transcript_10597/m.25851 type:complete len:206 (-) Transcript_10597:570-1187(-)
MIATHEQFSKQLLHQLARRHFLSHQLHHCPLQIPHQHPPAPAFLGLFAPNVLESRAVVGEETVQNIRILGIFGRRGLFHDIRIGRGAMTIGQQEPRFCPLFFLLLLVFFLLILHALGVEVHRPVVLLQACLREGVAHRSATPIREPPLLLEPKRLPKPGAGIPQGLRLLFPLCRLFATTTTRWRSTTPPRGGRGRRKHAPDLRLP